VHTVELVHPGSDDAVESALPSSGARSFGATMAGMRETIARLTAVAAESAADIDRLRAILVAAGHWEHAAVVSGDVDQTTIASLKDLTDCAADAFCLAWRLQSTLGARPGANLATYEMADPILEQVAPWIDGVSAQLAAVPMSDVSLTVEIGAGFDRFGIFPEQYAEAAQLWCRNHAGLTAAARASVVGAHAIGSTLSAVVAGVLRLNGWRVSRFGVQPVGNLSSPRVSLPSAEIGSIGGSTFVLIVDGDPMDGAASMWATAEAFAACGVDRRRVSYFPSTEETVDPTVSYRIRRSAIRVGAGSLVQGLATRSLVHFAATCSLRDVVIEELAETVPAYRIAMPDGRALIWRFAGVSVEADGVPTAEARRQEVDGVVDAAWGFLARPQE